MKSIHVHKAVNDAERPSAASNQTSAGVAGTAPSGLDAPTLAELDTLRHMLGINDPSKPKPEPYRNYAAVVPGDRHFDRMAGAGLVERYREAGNEREYDYYRCTERGESMARMSFKDIRWSKSKRVYSKFLEIRDALGDVSFRDFLTNPAYKQSRDSA